MLAMADGTAKPSEDSGYVIRNYGLAWGLGFDWCHDLMTPAQRQTIIKQANAFIAYWEAGKAFETEPTAGNYFAGYFCAKAMCALAMYEDNAAAPAQWADWRNTIFPAIADYFGKHLAGGGWPEGFQYGPLAILNMSLPIWAAKTATGEDLGFSFPQDCARFVMHATWPDGSHIDDRDLVHSGDAARLDADLLGVLQAVLNAWSDPFAAEFRAFRARYGAPYTEWKAVLFGDTDTAKASPSANLYAAGMGTMLARTSWASDATWISLRAAAYAGYPDAAEQLYDQGGLAMVKGGVPLLVNAWGAAMRGASGDRDEGAHITPVQTAQEPIFNVFMTASGGQWANTGASAKTTMQRGDGFTHIRATGLESLYGSGVTRWQRDAVLLDSGAVVVFDQTADNASDRWMQWHVPANYDTSRIVYAWPRDAAVKTAPIWAKSSPVSVTQLQVRSSTPGAWVTVFDGQNVQASDGSSVSVNGVLVQLTADGVTVNGSAPPPAPPPVDPPAPPPVDPPAPPPVDPPPSAPATVSVTRKGRWTVAGGTAHDTEIEALEDASNLALASPGTVIAITPPSYVVQADG